MSYTKLLAVLAGMMFLSSCAHDYHNPAVEADAGGSGGVRMTTASGAVTQGANVSDERKAKAQAFWGIKSL